MRLHTDMNGGRETGIYQSQWGATHSTVNKGRRTSGTQGTLSGCGATSSSGYGGDGKGGERGTGMGQLRLKSGKGGSSIASMAPL